MRQIWGKISALIIPLSLFVCSTESAVKNHIEATVRQFPNVLNIKNIPKQPENWSAFCFSDLGAWYGFALPSENDHDFYGAFPGPFLMTHGRWLSKCLAKLELYDLASRQELDLSKNSESSILFYPGLLSQQFLTDGLSIQLALCFISSRSVLIKATINNKTPNSIQLRASWTGNVFLKKAILYPSDNGISISFEGKKLRGSLRLPPGVTSHKTVSKNKKSYKIAIGQPFEIPAGTSTSIYLIHSLFEAPEDQQEEEAKIVRVFKHPDQYFSDSERRWNGYLRNVLTVDTPWANDESYRQIAVKAVMTLINNWRSPRKDLRHEGLFTSYAVSYFYGFWAWDSWKHAVALRKLAPELAKNQIRTMFDYQDQFGMVPDVIYEESKENNLRDTKPPLAAWAVWKVYEATGDKDFLREMFPKLVRYNEWWYLHRDHDQNSLCEYGSTDGTLVAAKWESGMDNAVRFDDAKMVKNDEHSWSMNQESVDLNSYLYAEKKYLAAMAAVLGDKKKADELMEEAGGLKSLIQDNMFDNETGYFYDIRLEDKSFIKVHGPEGWIPLWAGVATQNQAERVKQVMMDERKFATYIPFPTVARDNPEFSLGYWRGPVWLDQAYFAISGLRRYGFEEEAEEFTRQLFDRPQGLKDSAAPIRENYNPLTGKGLRVNHFSWSAAHLLLLFMGE